MHGPATGPSPRVVRHLMAMCSELGLTQRERRELIEFVLGVEGGSISRITAEQAVRLRDALTGALAVQTLHDLRPGRTRP